MMASSTTVAVAPFLLFQVKSRPDTISPKRALSNLHRLSWSGGPPSARCHHAACPAAGGSPSHYTSVSKKSSGSVPQRPRMVLSRFADGAPLARCPQAQTLSASPRMASLGLSAGSSVPKEEPLPRGPPNGAPTASGPFPCQRFAHRPLVGSPPAGARDRGRPKARSSENKSLRILHPSPGTLGQHVQTCS